MSMLGVSTLYSGIEEFEAAIGRQIGAFIRDPDCLYDLANWECFRAVLLSVGINPVTGLPRPNQKREQEINSDS